MDIMRRAAAGELSEVVGRATLEMDREARRLRIATLGRGARPNLAAAGPGLSRRIRARGEPLHRYASRCVAARVHGPAYDPRPWSVIDSVCIGLQMIRDLTTSWKNEIAKAAMLSAGRCETREPDLPGAHAARSSLPDRMHGRFPASERQPASRFWRMIRICTTTSRPPGT